MIASARLLRALLAVDIIALLFAISLATVTTSGPAKRTLARGVAILSEVDTYLDLRYETIRQQTAQAPDQPVTLTDFPVAVSFTPAEVQAGRDQFRTLLLRRAATTLRARGASAFQQPRGGTPGMTSPGGGIRAAIELLRPRPHWFLVGLSAILGTAALILGFGLARAERGSHSIGLLMLFSAATFVALSTAGWIAVRLAAASTDEYVAHEFLLLAGRLAWAPIRDGLIAIAGGLALTVAGTLLRLRPARQFV